VHGSILSWLYDLIIDLFKGAIKKAIEAAVVSNIKTQLQAEANKILATLVLDYHLDNYAELDYRLTSAPAFPSRYLELPCLAAVMPIAAPVPPVLEHSAMPFEPSGRMLDLQVDAYLFNSAMYTYFRANAMQATVAEKDVPATSTLHLNSSDFKAQIPNLFQAHPNKALMLKITATAEPSLTFTAVEQTLKAPLFMGVYAAGAAGWVEVFTIRIAASTQFRMKIDAAALRLVGDVDKFSIPVTAMTIFNTTIGPVVVAGLNSLVALGVDTVLLPYINKAFERGFPLPAVKGLEYIAPALKFGPGYVNIQTDIHFTPF
jgi:hypothetical protein